MDEQYTLLMAVGDPSLILDIVLPCLPFYIY